MYVYKGASVSAAGVMARFVVLLILDTHLLNSGRLLAAWEEDHGPGTPEMTSDAIFRTDFADQAPGHPCDPCLVGSRERSVNTGKALAEIDLFCCLPGSCGNNDARTWPPSGRHCVWCRWQTWLVLWV